VKEEAVLFGSSGALVGIVTDPEEERRPGLPAFVFLDAGVNHRVGPSRLHVRLSRKLAELGFPSMRFDFSGIGDSAVRTDDLPPEKSVVLETREAMDLLTERLGVGAFVLGGICSGATISFMTAGEDERVVGALLINAQGHLNGTDPLLGSRLRARTLTRHFWRIALRSSFRAKNWRKMLGGKLDPVRILRTMVGMPLRALFGSRETVEPVQPHDGAADLRALTSRGVKLFHLYCEGDEGLDYFHVVLDDVEAATSDENSRYEVIRGANHVFTLLWSQDRLEELVVEWANDLAGGAG
jgi:hypothetical protein